MKAKKIKPLLSLLLILAAGCPALALTRALPTHHGHLAGTRKSRFRRLFWNPVFRPSHESLLRQNEEIDRLDLPRIQDENELERLKDSQDLIAIIPTRALRIDPRLDPDRRYCRPWTLAFLTDLSESYYQEFHRQMQVNSAVRTVVVQKKLRRHNRNAAPETGETASSHLAGITIDIQRRGMTRAQVKWVEQYMIPLRDLNLVEPEEERHQWVFHVAVSARYDDWREAKMLAGEPVDAEAGLADMPLAIPSVAVPK